MATLFDRKMSNRRFVSRRDFLFEAGTGFWLKNHPGRPQPAPVEKAFRVRPICRSRRISNPAPNR